MNAELALELVRRSVMLALTVSAPLLATALLIGVAVSLVQALTQIQEQTLTFLPKLLGIGAVFLMVLPWMLRQLVQFIIEMIRMLPQAAG
jgi:flagellar biosynthetic protein FliQ